MKLNVEIENIDAEIKNQTLVIWSKTPLKMLSSALLNGGLVEANGIINVQVPEGSGSDMNDMHWSGPEDFLKKKVARTSTSKGQGGRVDDCCPNEKRGCINGKI